MPNMTEQRRKTKRRKIRSRQKNIRKDNRSDGEKPQHLVFGKRTYDGRPMTRETREKLGLPTPKARDGFYIDRTPTDTGLGDFGVALGVDDLLENDDSEVRKQVSSLKKKKKKKSKYKNL